MRAENFILVVYCFLFLSACKDVKNSDEPISLFDDKINPQKKELVISGDNLHNPRRIVVTDSFIILLDYSGKYCLSIYDKSGNYLFDYIKKGNGPNELIMPFDLLVDNKNNRFGIYDVALKSLCFYSMDSLKKNQNPTPIKRVKFDTKFFKVISIRNNKYVGIGPFDGGRYALIINGSLTGKFLNYPADELHKNEPDHIKAMAYQGNTAKRPGNSEFVMATSGTFEICTVRNDSIIRTFSHYSHLPKYVPKIEGEGYGVVYKPTNKVGYQYVSVTQENIFLLYSGRKFEDYKDNTQKAMLGNKILVYNWEGQPVQYFEFKEEIKAFAIDATNESIYLLTINPEPRIVRYDLSDYL